MTGVFRNEVDLKEWLKSKRDERAKNISIQDKAKYSIPI